MPRLSIGRRAMTVALSSMILMTTTLIPLAGITGAASTSSSCPTTTPSEGSPYTTCWLDIRSPSSVVAGATFTVQVAVTTSALKTTVATSDPCGSKAAITLVVGYPNESQTSQTVNASAGIATFSLNLTAPGDYSLAASGPNNDASIATAPSTVNCGSYTYVSDYFFPLTVVVIPAGAPIAPCPPDTSCVQASSGSGTQATLIASQGSTWNAKLGDYFGPVLPGVNQCGSSAPLDPNGVLTYTLGSVEPTGVIILALDPRGQGVGQFNVCWTQTAPFRTVTGALATTGDLPNCKQRDQVAPCIIARTGGSGGKVAFLTILATANDPDPRVYGH